MAYDTTNPAITASVGPPLAEVLADVTGVADMVETEEVRFCCAFRRVAAVHDPRALDAIRHLAPTVFGAREKVADEHRVVVASVAFAELGLASVADATWDGCQALSRASRRLDRATNAADIAGAYADEAVQYADEALAESSRYRPGG